MDDAAKLLAARVKEKLRELDRKPAWLAKQAGISPSTLSSILELKASPSLDTLAKIAPVLGYEIWELLSPIEIVFSRNLSHVRMPADDFLRSQFFPTPFNNSSAISDSAAVDENQKSPSKNESEPKATNHPNRRTKDQSTRDEAEHSANYGRQRSEQVKKIGVEFHPKDRTPKSVRDEEQERNEQYRGKESSDANAKNHGQPNRIANHPENKDRRNETSDEGAEFHPDELRAVESNFGQRISGVSRPGLEQSKGISLMETMERISHSLSSEIAAQVLTGLRSELAALTFQVQSRQPSAPVPPEFVQAYQSADELRREAALALLSRNFEALHKMLLELEEGAG